MTIDKQYCMSSFLMYRIIADPTKCFSKAFPSPSLRTDIARAEIRDSFELEEHLRRETAFALRGKKAALALSGGIDSAILAKMVPEGSVAYTFKCVVPGREVTDESPRAAKYAKECALKHRIVEIYWEDFERYAPLLMARKQAPIHSIEVQIYKAALQARADGFDTMIFGETADCVYGGHSNLLARDWTLGGFADRWTFVKPYAVLKDPLFPLEPYRRYERDGYIDVPAFLTDFEYYASLNSYWNAARLAEIDLAVPYASTRMKGSLDLARVRRGENKYLVREVFERLYPDFPVPEKTPMPRPMNEWLENWSGPVRDEFWLHCTDGMTGDQKWLVWALERFLNMAE